MTLIITELSEVGIGMVADSAIVQKQKTPSGTLVSRVLEGAQKLQVIPTLNAGISMWGLGSIEAENGTISTDLWVADFIERHHDIKSIHDFAETLASEIQRAVGRLRRPLGFHIAGYVEEDNEKLPAFYNVRNAEGKPPHYDYHEFIVGLDWPPRAINPGEHFRVRNGDYVPYALLADAVERIIPHISRTVDFTIPYPSLYGRVIYLTAWVKFVSDLYASSEILRSIGVHILNLGISPDGEIVSYSA